MIKSNMVFGDFETFLVKDKDNDVIDSKISTWCYVFLLDDKIYQGVGLQSFLTSIRSHGKNITIYFHNGSNFDFHFIVKNIENMYYKKINKYGYFKETFKLKLMESPKTNYLNNSEYPKKEKRTKDNILIKNNEYTTLISPRMILEIKITTNERNKEKTKYYLVTFRCSKLLFTQMSIKEMGKQVGIQKLEYDYNLIKEYKNIEEVPVLLLKYQKQDVVILKKFFKKIMNKKNMGENFFLPSSIKMTAASTAYNKWLELSLSQFCKILNYELKTIKTLNGQFERYYVVGGDKKLQYPLSKVQLSKKLHNLILPTKWISDESLLGKIITKNRFIRKWYRGGLSIINNFYKGKQLKNISSFDINSSYPNVMVNRMLPIGKPFFGDGGKDYPLKLIELTLKEFINKNGLPFLKIKNCDLLDRPSFGESCPQILKNIGKLHTFYITEKELEYFKKYYECPKYNIEVIFSFKSISGDKLFGDYINKFYSLKMSEKDKSIKLIYKLFLNSLYGKFGTNNKRDGLIWDHENKEYHREEFITNQKFYTPLSIYICMYARLKLVKTVGFHMKHFIYGDTDSIYIFDKYKKLFNIKIDDKKLGYWSLEWEKVNGVFRMKKQYLLYKNDGKPEDILKIVTAGIYNKQNITQKEYIKINNINPVTFVTGVMVKHQLRSSKMCNSGVILENVTKELKNVNDLRYPKIPYISY